MILPLPPTPPYLNDRRHINIFYWATSTPQYLCGHVIKNQSIGSPTTNSSLLLSPVCKFPVDDKNVENNWPEVFINQKSEKGIFIKLCSQHFERNCFKDDDRTLLKPRSVPTIFYPSTIYPHKQLPMKPLKRLRGRPKRAVIQSEPNVENSSEFELELTTETLKNRETIIKSSIKPAMANIEFVRHELAARGVEIDIMPSSTTTNVLEIQKEPDVKMLSELEIGSTIKTLQSRGITVEKCVKHAMANLEFIRHELAARGVEIDIMPSSTTTKVLEIQKEPDVEMPSEFDLELTTETLQNQETIVESQLEPAMTNIEFVCHELAARGVKIDMMPSSTTTKVLEIQKEPDVEMPSEFDLELTTETLQNRETIVESQLEPVMTNIEFVRHKSATRRIEIEQQDDKKIKISSAPVQLRKRNSMATSVISDDRPIIVCPAELVSNLKITTGQKEVPHLEKSAALNQGKIKKKSFEEQRDNTQIKVLLKPAQIPKITSIETNGTSHGRPLIEFPLELMFPFNKSQKILKRAKSAELNQKKVIRCYKLKKRFEHRFNQKQKRCRHTSQDG
ncbi:Zinc finger, C2CH-type [Cinara cedri]|uniref:Zinc finger, C2CH-type n=1 Tax=Cinara cedri TaxID=506608 RepID=A0A5E4NEC3_9HEMI|nr:Zinc finger, C2CH-type [Cinara cedri]